MTLIQLLTALSGNTSVNITLQDKEENCLITFNAPGYQQIENDLGARTVLKVWVTASNAVTIQIDDPQDP